MRRAVVLLAVILYQVFFVPLAPGVSAYKAAVGRVRRIRGRLRSSTGAEGESASDNNSSGGETMGESPKQEMSEEKVDSTQNRRNSNNRKPLRYPILILDHDDTAVDSTRSVHHASLQESFKRLKSQLTPPDAKCPNLAEWFELCGSPELVPWIKSTFSTCFDDEQAIWEEFKQKVIPEFFEGWINFLREYRLRGGKVVVASHSDAAFCKRHYSAAEFEPDLVYGWSENPDERKPSPQVVTEAVELLSKEAGIEFTKADVLVVDDLPTGYRMAKSAEVDFLGAQWCHKTPSVEKTLRGEGATLFLDDVDEFYKFILGQN